MKIRRVNIKEARKISKLRKKNLEIIGIKTIPKKELSALIKKNQVSDIKRKMKEREMFCIEEKNHILGVIDLKRNRIGGFFVRYNKINNGLGTKLLAFIENYAKKKGIKKVVLDSSKYARKFYLKRGYNFKNKKIFKIDGTSITNYHMEKILK